MFLMNIILVTLLPKQNTQDLQFKVRYFDFIVSWLQGQNRMIGIPEEKQPTLSLSEMREKGGSEERYISFQVTLPKNFLFFSSLISAFQLLKSLVDEFINKYSTPVL